MRYFEDFQVGERIELGSVTVTEEEIIAFAKQYDPQPFHISPELVLTLKGVHFFGRRPAPRGRTHVSSNAEESSQHSPGTN